MSKAFEIVFDWLSRQPSGDDVQDAADHFEVSPLTIKTTLVNKGDLPRDALGEWAV